MIKASEIADIPALLRAAKWLEGKTLGEVAEYIKGSDLSSRIATKGNVGYVIEHGFFGVEKNSNALPDVPHLGIEIKTCPLKYDSSRTKLSVKEPLSLNIINYMKEHEFHNLKESSLYKKNRHILFVFYIHDKTKSRSKYLVKYVFLWEMDDSILAELEPDYQLILKKIRAGRAHHIHQTDHKYLTLCPKHNGNFSDPKDAISKRKQPFSKKPAETRAFRLKNAYVNLIITRYLGIPLEKGGWK